MVPRLPHLTIRGRLAPSLTRLVTVRGIFLPRTSRDRANHGGVALAEGKLSLRHNPVRGVGESRPRGALPLPHLPQGAFRGVQHGCLGHAAELSLGCRRDSGRVLRISAWEAPLLLPGVRVSPDGRILRIGSLDEGPNDRPVAHIWTSLKAPWFEITDALPRFEESAPARRP